MSPRGGKRPGAGRPKEPGARVTLAVRVAPLTRRDLESYAEQWEVSLGEAIDYIVGQFGAPSEAGRRET